MHSPQILTENSAQAAGFHKYRPDIDGLRAVAVLAVVIFHAFPAALPSGFVGVDVFFIISGFLITSIILEEMAGYRFSFRRFYGRRIKRLFPALVFVLATSLIFGWFFLLGDEYAQLGKHTAAASAFIANFVFWQEASYFDVAADTKVLLHLWSLGIEEQFYLLWPAVVVFAFKRRFNLLTLFIVVDAASFAYNLSATRANPTVAFYSPLSRFWQLSAGAILAQLQFTQMGWVEPVKAFAIRYLHPLVFDRSREPKEKDSADFLSLLGATLIVAGVIIITRRHEFPGWWAMIPSTGAWFVLAAGPGSIVNRTLLSWRPLVAIGLISYPLYLWHWPILVFTKNLWPSSTTLMLLAAVTASFALAIVTYIAIERPLRFGRSSWWKVPFLCAAMLAIAAFGLTSSINGGYRSRLKDRDAYAAYFEGYLYDSSKHVDERAIIAQNRCNFYPWDSKWPSIAPRAAIDPACYTRTAPHSVMILGDSNSADLFYGLDAVLPKDISTLLIFSSGCPVKSFDEKMLQINHCDFANKFALDRIAADPPEVLLLSSNNSYEIDYIRKFSVLVRQHGVKKVFVLGQRPHWKPYLYKTIIKEFWYSTPRYIKGHRDEELLALGNKFTEQVKPDDPFEYVDQFAPFCNDSGCLTYLGDDPKTGLITFDDAHLRPFASTYLAEKQLAPMILNQIRK